MAISSVINAFLCPWPMSNIRINQIHCHYLFNPPLACHKASFQVWKLRNGHVSVSILGVFLHPYPNHCALCVARLYVPLTCHQVPWVPLLTPATTRLSSRLSYATTMQIQTVIGQPFRKGFPPMLVYDVGVIRQPPSTPATSGGITKAIDT